MTYRYMYIVCMCILYACVYGYYMNVHMYIKCVYVYYMKCVYVYYMHVCTCILYVYYMHEHIHIK